LILGFPTILLFDSSHLLASAQRQYQLQQLQYANNGNDSANTSLHEHVNARAREFPVHYEASWRAAEEEGELVIDIPDNELMVCDSLNE
jgi:hypothetical protein